MVLVNIEPFKTFQFVVGPLIYMFVSVNGWTKKHDSTPSLCLFFKNEIESTPVSISSLGKRYGLNGQTLRKQYKEVISGFREWIEADHANEYLIFLENIGEDLSLDETSLSNVSRFIPY